MSMDFPDMLASSIHTIKNSLALISSNLSEMIANPANHLADPRQASLLQHEVQRVNNNLIQLLTLYKLGNDGLMIDIAEHDVADLLTEAVAQNQAVSTALGLSLEYRCEPDLVGYFDQEMVRSVLDSTIGNAQRYARTAIALGAENEAGYTVIRVEDDGDGFSPQMLELATDPERSIASLRGYGRTRLGLLFAEKVARLHRAGDRIGRIELKNGHRLSGACFELWLP